MIKVYDKSYNLKKTFENVIAFMETPQPSDYFAVDELGFKYFQDGTGLGFRACRVLHKDLKRRVFYTEGVYAQEKASFKNILANAREIRTTFGIKQSLNYLKRLKTLKESR